MNYKANGYLSYNGTLFQPGQKVIITEDNVAKQLLADGVVNLYEEQLYQDEPSEESQPKSNKKKSIVDTIPTSVVLPEVVSSNATEQSPLGV